MLRFLVVDDALVMRKTLVKLLEKAGHTVVGEAADGEQAIDLYKQLQPDAVTMDITMPVMDGIEALKEIRRLDPSAKVIVISALGQKHKVFAALEEGAVGYLLKPIQEEGLLSSIQQLATAQCKNLLSDFTKGNLDPKTSTAYDLRPNAASLPFRLHTEENRLTVTLCQPFHCDDFALLKQAVTRVDTTALESIEFDFTVSNTLQPSYSGQILHVLQDLSQTSTAVRVTCHTKDYITYFRNKEQLQNVEFKLLRAN